MNSGENSFVLEELEEVKKRYSEIPDSELISCIPTITQIRITKTPLKQVTVCCQFPANYPHDIVTVELKSKTLSHKLLSGLTSICDAELKKKTGERQVLFITRFVHEYIESNRLCSCIDEILYLKRILLEEGVDKLQLKQKESQLLLTIAKEKYFFRVKINIPELYPDEQLKIELQAHNFPDVLQLFFVSQANEIARKCVHPPIRPNPKDPPFTPRPALRPVMEFLIQDSVKRYAMENCPLCSHRALPPDPEQIPNLKKTENIVRIYCSHIFHYGCMDKYMNRPPFGDGKPCPSCKKNIYHDAWKTSLQTRETRWAAKQAKARELEEVVDFMS